MMIRHSLTNVGELEVTFNRIADSNLTYTLSSSDDLTPGSWSSIWTGTGTSAGTVTVPESAWPNSESQHFFRLEVSY